MRVEGRGAKADFTLQVRLRERNNMIRLSVNSDYQPLPELNTDNMCC